MLTHMDEKKNFIEKIGIGKLAAAICLIIFFIFNPEVFRYIFVASLLFFPIYILISKWLDRQ